MACVNKHLTAGLTRPRGSANCDLQKIHAKRASAGRADLFGSLAQAAIKTGRQRSQPREPLLVLFLRFAQPGPVKIHCQPFWL
jgi:hypothetical protein